METYKRRAKTIILENKDYTKMKDKIRKIHFNKNDLDILQRMAKGYTDKEIADELCLAQVTIRNYINKMMHLSMTVNRAHLVYWALREKYIK